MQKGFVPSTGFSHRASLDAAVRPYLARVSHLVAVDFLSRGKVEKLPRGVATLMSPGSSRAFFRSAAVRVDAQGLGELGWDENESPAQDPADSQECPVQMRWLNPAEVLRVQCSEAQKAWVLDLPCPFGVDPTEGSRRVHLTISNARWARSQSIGDLDLWGPVVGWDEASYSECARAVASMGYRTLVLSGLWSWMRLPATMCRIVECVRQTVGDALELHVTGIGNPEIARRLSERGVTSVDGASFVRAADRGVQWDAERVLADGSRIEKTHMAIANAATIGREMEEGWKAYCRRLVRGVRGR